MEEFKIDQREGHPTSLGFFCIASLGVFSYFSCMMKQTTNNLDPETAKNVSLWLDGNYDDETKDTIRQLLQNNVKEAIDAFYTNLAFGTGGMRGIMGVGSNRMNDYTIRAATQGLANYVNHQPAPPHGHSALIGFDSRHHSRTFAEETAKVLAANGFRVFLCQDLRPTPLISFGCRFLNCSIAVMITASHNPPEYNGYKVFWNDGGQVLPSHDAGIMSEVAKVTDPSMVKTAASLEDPLISLVAEEIDVPYISEGSLLQLFPKENREHGRNLKIVYTSLHGTGITLMPDMLKHWGFPTVAYVDSQITPDGDFPTVTYPNPEEKAALTMGIATLKETESDILLATDPDADRVGVVVRQDNDVVLLNGNQVAALLLAHVCEGLTAKSKMPPKGAFVKTIVTTELFTAICNAYKKTCFDVLPGFKYIAEKILVWEEDPEGHTFIFGGEDSCGYLFDTLTRDKDGIIASALVCEAALSAKRQGKTLVDVLHDLFQKHGVFVEELLSLKFEESKTGKGKIRASMENLRCTLPQQIHGVDVVAVVDYLTSTKTSFQTGKTEKIDLPKSNVLSFWLADTTKIIVRPSGTEPKVKLYCGVHAPVQGSIALTEKMCQKKAAEFLSAMKDIINA